jgi:hypothetical protein
MAWGGCRRGTFRGCWGDFLGSEMESPRDHLHGHRGGAFSDGSTAEILTVAQGALANRPDHGAVQPTKPRSNSRAKAISVSPARRVGLRSLSQKLCTKAYAMNDVSRKLTIAVAACLKQ